MKRRISSVLFTGIVFICLTGCSSVPYKEKLILTGLVVDENGSPVRDFEMKVESPSVKNSTVYTNESGVFSLNHAKKGKYSFSGKKEGYTLVDEKRDIKSFSQVYCFHVLSGDGVFDEVNLLAEKGEYKAATEVLETIYVKQKSSLRECVSFYKRRLKKERK